MTNPPVETSKTSEPALAGPGEDEEARSTARNINAPVSRDELYDLVWSEPLRALAPRLGLSDVGLAKACRKMKIPLPGRGFWAKKAAGKRLGRAKLPRLSERDTDVPRELTTRDTHPPDAEARSRELPPPVAEQVEFESRPANRIVVREDLRSPHPLIRTTRDVLRRSARAPTDYVSNWQVKHLDMEVSKASLPRALRIMNAAVKAFEKRGWKVSLGAGEDRGSYVTVLGQRIAFGIREPWKQVQNEPAKPRRLVTGEWYTPFESEYRQEPSGRLALVVRNSWGHAVDRSLAGGKKRTVEERLNDYMVLVVSVAHERSERERRHVEAEKRRWEAEQVRLAEKWLREMEAARVQALEAQASNWRRSREVSEFVAAVRSRAAEEDLDPSEVDTLERWVDWAERHARSLDPLNGDVRDIWKATAPMSGD